MCNLVAGGKLLSDGLFHDGRADQRQHGICVGMRRCEGTVLKMEIEMKLKTLQNVNLKFQDNDIMWTLKKGRCEDMKDRC